MSLRSLQEIQVEGDFREQLIIGALPQISLALDFVHEAGVVHTVECGDVFQIASKPIASNSIMYNLHSDNLLIGIGDKSVFTEVEENEMEKPSPRKVIGDTVIQVSQYMLNGRGPLILCDLFGSSPNWQRASWKRDARTLSSP
ncbi:protein kinase-like protein [Metarhizium album ARSEF 1941]|uniref:Protein kinase-like protein n=1 Tax=Metarhizium album (strain ARSEF 1941) TaxID=1081103 RepID=A0A0B2WLQ3_METAS|nr:protein kinase-like protein [Metarhizium album ARSEF 1941]KHN94412.1 protein kinase-like protein [Metarhizium album ARSEF 1941]